MKKFNVIIGTFIFNMKSIILISLAILFIGFNSLFTFAQSGNSFTIEKSVIAGGGGNSDCQFRINGNMTVPNAFVR